MEDLMSYQKIHTLKESIYKLVYILKGLNLIKKDKNEINLRKELMSMAKMIQKNCIFIRDWL